MTRPLFQPPLLPVDHLANAQTRRALLEANGLTTHALTHLHGPPSITCLCCGFTSCLRQNILGLYCAYCNAYHQRPT